MRKIRIHEILTFLGLLLIILCLGISSAWLLFGCLPLGDFRGIVLVFTALLCVYLYAFAIHRIFLAAFPIPSGEIARGSREEFSYHVYLLFYLILFYPILRSGFMPVPLMRLVYQVLGAKLGENTYSSGIILDPKFVSMGDHCLVGQYALLVPHVIEGEKLAHYAIEIGNHVTIGAHAVVLAGVKISDRAIVATGAIVTKGTVIGADEVWGGVPAKRLK